MKILVANRHLQGLGGSETFTYTLAAELKKQGHNVEYFTLYKGITSAKIEALGVPLTASINYDLIIAGQVRTIETLRKLHYTGPLVQVCHGAVTPGEQPHPEADAYIAISEEVQNHLAEKGIDAPVILNGIDCQRFKPRRKLRKKLKLIASLVQTDEAHEMVVAAASKIGAQVIRANKYTDKIWEVETMMDKADLVVSLGRGCYEAMACGRPVVVFDKRRYQQQLADGYLTPANFNDFVKNNCSGRFTGKNMGVDELATELQKYNSTDGAELRKIALRELDVKKQTLKILDYCRPLMENYNYPGTTDVVYVLGKGSKWGDNEIRYSIRSFKQHFKDLRNVVIVGELPLFLRGLVHIPYPDKQGVNKDCRMMLKIKAACEDPRVSENFVLCTDDTILLRDLRFADFTGWHEGPMFYDAETDQADHMSAVINPQMRKPGTWFEFCYNTGRELKKRGLPDNNYDRAHSPQPINKQEFIEVLNTWDMVGNHYTVSNIYNNSSKLFKGENIRGRNLKVYGPATVDQLDEITEGRWCMNFSDPSLNSEMKAWLHKRFPHSSEFELFNTAIDRRTAAEEWVRNGRDYDTGVAIFAAHAPKNFRLIKWFKVYRGTLRAERKLQKTMELWMH